MDDTLSFPEIPADRAREPVTRILTRRDIAGLMWPRDYFDAVEAGFRALAEGQAVSPAPLHLPLRSGGLHGKGAAFGPAGVVAIKANANVPGNPARLGLPTIQGAVLLFDADDGRLLAILDSIEITLRRTAAATALAASHLARRDARSLAICGCGAQALPQLQALLDVLPIQEVRAWDIDPAPAAAFADTAAPLVDGPIRIAATLEEATEDAEVIVTCTSARQPFLSERHVAPGAFIAAVGADAPDKSEIAPSLMARARVVVDVLEQALAMGDLRHAVAAGAMNPAAVHATLGDLVTGRREGRTAADQVFVFDSTGTGAQDVAAAAAIHARAVAADVGTAIRLGG
jgi:ornithine cyclodeaminase/alanine dehydrogenase-like protein (mu-crystallin family)